MKITLSQIKCHLITIYCFILMIQSYYNINNAKTLRYINVCIWSTYEVTLYCAFKIKHIMHIHGGFANPDSNPLH